jgi:hypothetical protein
MGSFNVSCGFSNVSIDWGDRTTLFVMRPKGSFNPYHNTTNIVTNHGCHGLMLPLLLPIHGTYADYGVIDDIEETVYTKYLEKRMGMSIEEIAESVARGEDADNNLHNILDPCAGMFVLTHFFDNARDIVVNKLKMNVEDEADVSAKLLKRLGFKEKGLSEDKKERYNRRFEHPEVSKAYVMSDGTWVRLFEEGREDPYQSLYHPNTFAAKWLEVTGHALDLGKMKVESLWKNIGKSWHESLKRREDMDSIDLLDFYDRYGNYFGKAFTEIHRDLLISDNYIAIEDALEDYSIFSYLMGATNRMYRPSHNGHQFGDKAAEDAVASLIAQVSAEKHNQHLIDYGEDY